MQENGKVDINETLKAWADIVIEKWHNKLTELKVYDQGFLYDSLLFDLLLNAGENIQKIEFSFKLYGIYVDMGVGGEMKKGNSGDLGFTPTRKPKEWYSKKFYGQVMRLREILMEQYGRSIAYSMMNTLSENLDQRYENVLQAPTIKNLRSVVYRAKNNQRTQRNYNSRRASDGRWTNDSKTWKN
jgi:hypothetical protein